MKTFEQKWAEIVAENKALEDRAERAEAFVSKAENENMGFEYYEETK